MQPEKQRYNCGSLVAREMQLSVLGFGCGAVGGFMVRGDPVSGSAKLVYTQLVNSPLERGD